MSGRRIVGAMFICMAALFYIAKYVLFEIHFFRTSFDDEVSKFQSFLKKCSLAVRGSAFFSSSLA
ncbi:hypothetical protein [Bacillus safensis]|uniref:hypothetical protein n=1 Tax=Bacillus safensis TaxID=561879 RepID=UPI00398377CC